MLVRATVATENREWMIRGGRVAPFNRLVRLALEHAANYWVKHFLPMHFRSGASERYGYPPRNQKYLQHKIYAPFVQEWNRRGTGNYVPNPNYRRSPQPFVYTGALRDYVLDRADAGELKPRAVSTSNVQRVEVRVGYPHPLRPRDAGWITRLIDSERDVLLNLFVTDLRRRMRATPTTREVLAA